MIGTALTNGRHAHVLTVDLPQRRVREQGFEVSQITVLVLRPQVTRMTYGSEQAAWPPAKKDVLCGC
ncbi:hypothetical protein ACFWJM_25200 [Streptomyces sp. NPDC127077]|uniref:hypothetical protein n=1 Tax=Streptomyces sp. NPDC127077 TaxID=3347131 RepID=UPI003662B04B